MKLSDIKPLEATSAEDQGKALAEVITNLGHQLTELVQDISMPHELEIEPIDAGLYVLSWNFLPGHHVDNNEFEVLAKAMHSIAKRVLAKYGVEVGVPTLDKGAAMALGGDAIRLQLKLNNAKLGVLRALSANIKTHQIKESADDEAT